MTAGRGKEVHGEKVTIFLKLKTTPTLISLIVSCKYSLGSNFFLCGAEEIQKLVVFCRIVPEICNLNLFSLFEADVYMRRVLTLDLQKTK